MISTSIWRWARLVVYQSRCCRPSWRWRYHLPKYISKNLNAQELEASHSNLQWVYEAEQKQRRQRCRINVLDRSEARNFVTDMFLSLTKEKNCGKRNSNNPRSQTSFHMRIVEPSWTWQATIILKLSKRESTSLHKKEPDSAFACGLWWNVPLVETISKWEKPKILEIIL